MPTSFFTVLSLLGLSALAGPLPAPGTADPLVSGFQDPPDSAKPRTWWHWTGGNVTLEGITRDLEIKVTNQWTNRLIGDRLLPTDQKVLNSSVAPGGIGAGEGPALPQAGLLGPVTLRTAPK